MMIALLLALQATESVQITGARRSTEADRVFGRAILFQCEVPLDGTTLAWQVALEGEITGVGKGPLSLVISDSAPVTKFKSYRGSVSYEAKLPYGRRPLFVSLSSQQDIARERYFSELSFTYMQDEAAPNLITRAAQVSDPKITFYKARDMLSGYGVRFARNGARPAGTGVCIASDRNPQ